MYRHASDGERLVFLQLSALLKDFRNSQDGKAADNRDRVHVHSPKLIATIHHVMSNTDFTNEVSLSINDIIEFR